MKIIVFFIAFIAFVIGQHLPLVHNVAENSYILSSQPNRNYWGSSSITVSNGLLGETRAVLKFNLDGTVAFFDITNYEVDGDFVMDDCNHWSSILGGSLVIDLFSSHCPLETCVLSLYSATSQFCERGVTWHCPYDSNTTNHQPDCTSEWSGGNLQEENIVDRIAVSNGQFGNVTFDVTTVLQSVVKPYFNRTFIITVDFGTVTFSSKEASDTPGAQILVTNPEIPVDEQCARLYTTVSGFNISYLLCTPDGGAMVYGKNQVLIGHGQPEFSYLWSYFGQQLATSLEINVFILDMLGSGYSEHVLDLSIWDYSLSNQSNIIDGFIYVVDMTQGGTVKIHHIVFEEGLVSFFLKC